MKMTMENGCSLLNDWKVNQTGSFLSILVKNLNLKASCRFTQLRTKCSSLYLEIVFFFPNVAYIMPRKVLFIFWFLGRIEPCDDGFGEKIGAFCLPRLVF